MNPETVYRRFSDMAGRRKDSPFLHVLGETADAYGIAAGDITYAEMARRVDARAASFSAAGYGAGQRIGLLLENRPVFIEIWLALNRLGASVVPINPDLRVAELEYLTSHSDMCLAIVLPERIKDVQLALINTGLSFPVCSADDQLVASVQQAGSALTLDSQTECALLYTSGTTGQPKGCILSNEYFLHCGDWYAQAGGLMNLQPDVERMLTPLPLFHMNAMAVSVMAMMTTGGCLIQLDRFHPRSWWQSVQRSDATIVHYLGVMPTILMRAEACSDERQHKVRFGFGAGVDKKLHAPFEQRCGFPLVEAWACTETGSGGVISAHDEPRNIGTACFGRPGHDVAVRVVDDAGHDVAVGVPGEMLVRGNAENPRYGFFSGYLKNQAATDELWAGGWLHTGDVVVQGEHGDLHFIDRKKNVIRRSGENIAAVEVETVLNRHPEIGMSAAVAAPDDVRGDEVAVFIILDDTNAANAHDKAGEAKANEIVIWALQQMAYFKVPGWVAFVEQLPLTATQKILRGEVKKLLTTTLAENAFIDTRHLKKRQV